MEAIVTESTSTELLAFLIAIVPQERITKHSGQGVGQSQLQGDSGKRNGAFAVCEQLVLQI